MQIKIHPNLIFRTPKFSLNADLQDNWDELKTAISISSDAFYQTVKDVKADELDQLPPKVFFTIWKYFNRAKFRSTPYGTFAGFSFLKSAEMELTDGIVVQKRQDVHEFVDWPEKNKLHLNYAEILKSNVLLFSNSSYYLFGPSIRYIACADGTFELAEIDRNELVLEILNACLKPVSTNDLIALMKSKVQDEEELMSLLEDMLSLQLLFSEQDPNIIGQDYFERIGIKPQQLPKYLIAERKVISGKPDDQILYALPSFIQLLQKLIPADERSALKQFIQKFKKKFDQAEVPLMIALDPEMGVGYDELEQGGHQDEFINQFSNTIKDKEENSKELLKKALTGDFFQKAFAQKTVQLDKLNLDLKEPIHKLPNSFSLVCTIADDQLVLDQIGGSTANALSGRFTMASQAVLDHCIEISSLEAKANPDVLFFDVAYLVETNVDNVNRRKLLYEKQLSILNFDSSSDPLSLEDLMISINGNEVILRSKKLNQRLVPRMASAYNYTRSDLSVFRLLCDLQHQNIQSSLNFSLEQFFPDLSYYPRLQYKNIIIKSAKWIFNAADLKSLSSAACRNKLKAAGISPYFKTGLSDQTLCFDLESDIDLNALLQYAVKQEKLVLEEVILPAQSLVKDQFDQPYLAQFIYNLFHEETIYLPVSRHSGGSVVKRSFAPGSEWLYFEIFCHQQRSDYLLAGPIAYFLDEFASEIKSWFFIRYPENGYHIRFRVLLHDPSSVQKLTTGLNEILTMELESGMVSDVTLKTYRRELERYGEDLMEEVETHFEQDSSYTLSVLEAQAETFTKYAFCIQLLEQIKQDQIFDSDAFDNSIKKLSDSFNREHHLGGAEFKKLNSEYQLFRRSGPHEFDPTQQARFSVFTSSLKNVLKKSEPKRQVQLLADLFHMHVNRLFNNNQRTHEMVIYYFMLKELQRMKALKR